MKICILDPGLQNQDRTPSLNLGDLIIQEAVNRELGALFPQASLLRFSTHAALDVEQLQQLAGCDLILVGGTNLLSSRMSIRNRSSQWAINAWDALRIRRAVLLGVGWQSYQSGVTLLARIDLRLALSSKMPHSVRDAYTHNQLAAAGFKNVINTGCVTMWPFVDFDFATIPSAKADHVLVMLTDYDKNPESDRALLGALAHYYHKVLAWPQGAEDERYFRELDFVGVMLERSLDGLDELLRSSINFDYIGTRLHGGIRCLLNRRRSLILEIDNRAAEIARETGLPTARRGDIARIEQWIKEPSSLRITMNSDAITRWRTRISSVWPLR